MAETQSIDSLMASSLPTYRHTYTERDVILYALGLGCTAEHDLKYVYEHEEGFAPLPTWGLLLSQPITFTLPLEHYIPKYQPGGKQDCVIAQVVL